jgi:hypothetical protein
MAIPKYLNRQELARYLEISTTRVAQIGPKPDILLGDAPGWLPETAARIKRDREGRRSRRRGEQASEATA